MEKAKRTHSGAYLGGGSTVWNDGRHKNNSIYWNPLPSFCSTQKGSDIPSASTCFRTEKRLETRRSCEVCAWPIFFENCRRIFALGGMENPGSQHLSRPEILSPSLCKDKGRAAERTLKNACAPDQHEELNPGQKIAKRLLPSDFGLRLQLHKPPHDRRTLQHGFNQAVSISKIHGMASFDGSY